MPALESILDTAGADYVANRASGAAALEVLRGLEARRLSASERAAATL